MQCYTLKENFIFSSQINIEYKNSELSESNEAILLVTINALYIFKKTEQIKNDEFLEDKLLLKCLHDDIYIKEFINEKNEIKYESYVDPNLEFSIKIEDSLAKEYIKILALFEGWKLAVRLEKEKNDIKEKNNKKEIGKNTYPKSFFYFK